MLYIGMLKTAIGSNVLALGGLDLVALAGETYKVTQQQYDYLRAGFSCRQLRDTETVRKRAKDLPKVAGGGEMLLQGAKKAEEEFIDAPFQDEPPITDGIIETPATKGPVPAPVTPSRK